MTDTITKCEDGTWSLVHQDKTYGGFKSRAAAEVALALHRQAEAVEKRHDGVSPAQATEGYGKPI